MSNKSSDTEDWEFVDNEGEIELSDEGSSSSVEIVNVENDVVTYQNRRSLERSVSPVPVLKADKPDSGLEAVESNSEACKTDSSNSLESCSGNNGKLQDDQQHNVVYGETETLKTDFSPLNYINERDKCETSDTNSFSLKLAPSEVSDNSSDADSDYIRLEATDSLDGDSMPDNSAMSSSSVSSSFNFISRENSPLASSSTDNGHSELFNSHNGSVQNIRPSPEEDKGDIEESHRNNVQQLPEANLEENIQNLENNNQEDFHNLENTPQDNMQNLANNDHDLEANFEENVAHNGRNLAGSGQDNINEDIQDASQHIRENNQVSDEGIRENNHNDGEAIGDDGANNERIRDDNQDNINEDIQDANQHIRENNQDNGDGNRENIHNVIEDNADDGANNEWIRDDNQDNEVIDESAEVEEDQDRYDNDSGTEDDRIESDQSDAGSIPPLDDDMSFVNDIGDLPLIAGARQYVHNPNQHLNLMLNIVAILMIAVVVGLGIGHAIATFDEIEEFDSLHLKFANLKSQAVSCQNQKSSQKVTINNIKIEQEKLNQKYVRALVELDKFRAKNSLLKMQLDKLESGSSQTMQNSDTRIKLQNEINQLKTEKEELKQLIGQLKYTTYPATDISGSSDNVHISTNDLCDKTALDSKAALKYTGGRLSDFSLDDLHEIHKSESLDNSRLKQQVGRLRYTTHPGSVEDNKALSEDQARKINNEHVTPQKTHDFNYENITAIKEELARSQKTADIWYKKYEELKEQNQLNSSNCLKYILTNLTANTFFSSIDKETLQKWLKTSSTAAQDLQNSLSHVTKRVWNDISRTSKDIIKTISEEFQLQGDTVDDDVDDHYTESNHEDPIPFSPHTATSDNPIDKDTSGHDSLDQSSTDKNENLDDISDEVDDDADTSNNTKENAKPPHAKWSDNVKDILNKTRNKMSNVSQQIKDTWLQVKNLSTEFWAKHEGTVTDTFSKISNKVSNFGKRIQSKIQRKLSKWYKKDKKGHKKGTSDEGRFEKSARHNKQKQGKKNKAERHNVHKRHQKHFDEEQTKRKQDKHYAKQKSKQDRWQAKQKRQQGRHDKQEADRKFRKQTVKQDGKMSKMQHKLNNKIGKFLWRMSKRMTLIKFEKMGSIDREAVLNRIYHIKVYAENTGFLSGHEGTRDSQTNEYLEALQCQDLWWSGVVVKDFPSDAQILQCSTYLSDWQLLYLLKRRQIQDRNKRVDKNLSNGIFDLEIKFGLKALNDNIDTHNQLKDRDTLKEKDESYSKSKQMKGEMDESTQWQFDRALFREELRKKEEEQDWLSKRANFRKNARNIESEPDWLFDRSSQREDIRYREWEQPEWTFTRAKLREEVRKEEHQPDWVFDRAHDRKEQRDYSSSKMRDCEW